MDGWMNGWMFEHSRQPSCTPSDFATTSLPSLDLAQLIWLAANMGSLLISCGFFAMVTQVAPSQISFARL